MQTNTETRQNLKSQFNSIMAECRQGRLLLQQSRDLRHQAHCCQRHQDQQARELTTQANALLTEALALRGGDRELCLALAFLNGTAYCKAETNPTTPASSRQLTAYLKDALPTELRDGAKDLAIRWLTDNTLRLRDFYQEAQDAQVVQEETA